MKKIVFLKRKLENKEWNLLIICFIIITVLLADIALRQVYSKLSRLNHQVTFAESEFIRLNRVIKQKEAVESAYSKAIDGLRPIRVSDDFLQEIEAFAKQAGLNVRNIRPLATKKDKLYKVFPVRMEAQDQGIAVGRFLYSLAQEFKGVSLKRIEINAQRKNELPKINVLFEAVIFE